MLDNNAETPTTTDLVSIQLGGARLALEPISKKWRIVSNADHKNASGLLTATVESAVTGAEDSRLSVLRALESPAKSSPKKSTSSSPFANLANAAQASSIKQLKNHIQDLEEENNMLKFRQEILLDMLSVKELDRANYEIIFQKLGIRPDRLKKRKD